MTRWLVTGAGGLLGREILAAMPSAFGLPRTALDVTDPSAVRNALADHRPDVVVNCAAWADVDAAESHEAEARLVNGDGPRILAEACAASGARLLHLSTDYVFPGDADCPYAEGDLAAPTTAYGRTKLAGEHAVLARGGTVVRTGWLYGAYGPNFVTTMIRLEKERDTVDVVADQCGQPTWARDVARTLAGIDGPGIFHATNTGVASWHELAQECFRLLGADPQRVRAIPSTAYESAARRPAYTVLANHRLPPLRPWRQALHEAFPLLAHPDYSLGV